MKAPVYCAKKNTKDSRGVKYAIPTKKPANSSRPKILAIESEFFMISFDANFHKTYQIIQKKITFASLSQRMAKKETEDKTPQNQGLTKTESFIDQYKKPIIIGAGALVVIVLGIVGYQKLVSEPTEIESRDAYWNAFYDFEADSLDAAANGDMNNMGMADVADEYAGTSGGDIANYSMGIIQMRKEDFQGALNYFDACDFEDIMLGNMVIGLKGDCYVQMGDYETAVDLFEKAAEREANQFTSPLYYKKAGLAYEALNDNESAVTVYEKIKNDWPKSDEARDIEKYIVRAQN